MNIHIIIGLAQGESLCFEGVNPMYASLPATLMNTIIVLLVGIAVLIVSSFLPQLLP